MKSTSVKENYWTALRLGENYCRRVFILIRHRDIFDGGGFNPVPYVDTNLSATYEQALTSKRSGSTVD